MAKKVKKTVDERQRRKEAARKGGRARKVPEGALEGLARRLRQSVELVAAEVLDSERRESASAMHIASELGQSPAGRGR